MWTRSGPRGARAPAAAPPPVARQHPHPQAASPVVGVDHVGPAQEPVHPHRARPGRTGAQRQHRDPRAHRVEPRGRGARPPPPRARPRPAPPGRAPAARACSSGPPRGIDVTSATFTRRGGGGPSASTAASPPSSHSGTDVCTDRKFAETIADHERRLHRGRDPQAVGVLGHEELSSRPRGQRPRPADERQEGQQRRDPALGQHLEVGVVHDRVLEVQGVVADVVARLDPEAARPDAEQRAVRRHRRRRPPVLLARLDVRRRDLALGRQALVDQRPPQREAPAASTPATTNRPARTPPKRVRRVATAHSTTAARPTSAPRESVPSRREDQHAAADHPPRPPAPVAQRQVDRERQHGGQQVGEVVGLADRAGDAVDVALDQQHHAVQRRRRRGEHEDPQQRRPSAPASGSAARRGTRTPRTAGSAASCSGPTRRRRRPSATAARAS